MAAPDTASITVGTELPQVRLPITYTIVATLPASTRDYFPGHHDPAYARAQGNRTIYLNTPFYNAFVDRVALEWAGPGWFVQRRAIRMKRPVFPDDVLVGTGRVTEVLDPGGDDTRVVLAVDASTQAGVCVAARITLARAASLR
jgi:acyl dehydratase